MKSATGNDTMPEARRLTPDHAEEAHAELLDDLVPSYGYQRIPVVGLGGSAGSIEALQVFFSNMPSKTGLAFVVVIHLAPDHESVLTEVLQRYTTMRVVKVEDHVRVEPDVVFVIPPGKTLQSVDGELRLGEFPSERSRNAAVDLFLRTLADSHGPHAAAVVLSGLDGDGAVGIKRIKERGGLTVVQDPEEAQYGSMPRKAMQTGMVDWVLQVKDIPQRLMSYFRMEQQLVLPPEDPHAAGVGGRSADEGELREVLAFLRTRTGRDFSQYKRATIVRRIARRMQVNGVDNLVGYLNCLRTRPGEPAALLQDLLISVTNFFRDAECFAALEARIPSLFEGKAPGEPVRAWVVACASGEEAYSVAMLLADHAREMNGAPPPIQVFATDLDEQAIRVARDGVYPATITADVSEERLRRYFTNEHGGYRVKRELREYVLFACHDLLRDSPFSRLDLITCRNLLIYLNREAQTRVMEMLHFSLLPHGRLMLGASESVDEDSPLFAVQDKKHRIFSQKPTRRVLPVERAPLPSNLTAPPVLRELHVVAAAGQNFDPPSRPARQDRDGARAVPWGRLHLDLLEQLAPPSVLVDSQHEIVHVSASAGRFLRVGGGEPTKSLLHALPAEIRVEVRAALYQSEQARSAVQIGPVSFPVDGKEGQVVVRVVPMQDGSRTVFLLTFDVLDPQRQAGAEPLALLPPDSVARHLDGEIERLKAGLRETVEQYEASTEELKASNEELQAMNEELRAATEELETGREELQSINEELHTVNMELKNKVEQLSHANSDIQNLIDATAIATVFLDRELRITRFTPPAVDLFNLIAGDVGRPLLHMATQLDYPTLGDDARRVLERLVPVEREVGESNGNWYLARIVPYRTGDDRIAGVVLTFIDITERKRAEEMRMWLAAVVSSTSDAIISFALDGTILSWNPGAEHLFGYAAEDAIGHGLEKLGAAGGERSEIRKEVAAGRAVQGVETVRRRKDGSEVYVAITASPIRDPSGRVVAGTSVVRDVSAAHEAAEALRQSEERMRMVLENAREYAIFSTDLQRKITIWNAGAQRLLGYAEKEAIGMSADVIFVPEDRAQDAPALEARTALEAGRAADEREHLRKDGSRFPGHGVMMLMRDRAGEATGFLKILRDGSKEVPDPPA